MFPLGSEEDLLFASVDLARLNIDAVAALKLTSRERRHHLQDTNSAIGDGFNSRSSSTQRPTMAHPDPDAPPVHETSSSGERVSFEVTLHEDAGKSLLVTITPPREPTSKEKQPGRRAPLDLCLVINVSRSMSALIEEGKSKESKGLSVLDVVKHACCTILSTMQDDNRLSVVTFTKEVRVSAHPRDDCPT